MSGTVEAETGRKKGSRRSAMEQASGIEEALVRARTSFILEGDEPMAEFMRKMRDSLTEKLNEE